MSIEVADPFPGVIEAMACDSCAAAAEMLAVNVSDTESPLVSLAVTLRPSDVAVAGVVPLNVSVVPLNVNQAGKAAPFDCDAE